MPKLLFDMYGVLMRPVTPESHADLERLLAPPDAEAMWEAYGFYRPDYDAGIFSDSHYWNCLLYTSPSPRDGLLSRMPSSA